MLARSGQPGLAQPDPRLPPHTASNSSGNDQVIEYNHVRHVAVETADMGAIYCGGRDWLSPRGSVIRYNYFHDILGYGHEEGQVGLTPLRLGHLPGRQCGGGAR